MYNKMILITTLLFSAAFTQPLFADEGNKPATQHHSCGCMKNLTEKLGLSPEQAEKIKAIKQKSSEEKAKYQQELSALHHQIKKLMKASKLNEAKLDVLLDQKKELMKARIKSKYEAKQQMLNVLTAEQKVKFEAMLHNKK